MNKRAYNFSAGPAMLPEAILQEAQAELLNWQGLGLSILEVGHRTDVFQSMLNEAKQDLRDLLSIPDSYHILFLGGAARTQFAMVPLNFSSPEHQGGYLVSGFWSALAFSEGQKVSQAYCVASSENNGFVDVPPHEFGVPLKDNTAYLYFAPNETIHGVRFACPPNVNVPLIADMTSCFLSEPFQIEDYGLIFAGAQKNIANAGLTIVLIREDMLDRIVSPSIPTMLDYRTHVHHASLYATPPVFNCYLAAKMFKWVLAQGGVSALYEQNAQKANRLYQFIDESTFYHCKVKNNARSLMNVCFSLEKPFLEDNFIQEAAKRGLLGLKGHRKVGGLRASLYNAMPMEGVEHLIAFMSDFAGIHQ